MRVDDTKYYPADGAIVVDGEQALAIDPGRMIAIANATRKVRTKIYR
jgi:hypothetical protein